MSNGRKIHLDSGANMAKQFLVVTSDEVAALDLRTALATSTGGDPTVSWAPTLAGAIGELAWHRTDLIILDCNLPDSHGLATLDAVHELAPRTPILTLHESEADSSTIFAMQRGARGFLVKGNYGGYMLPLALANIIGRDEAEQRLATQHARAS